jgi:hypothetical protein
VRAAGDSGSGAGRMLRCNCDGRLMSVTFSAPRRFTHSEVAGFHSAGGLNIGARLTSKAARQSGLAIAAALRCRHWRRDSAAQVRLHQRHPAGRFELALRNNEATRQRTQVRRADSATSPFQLPLSSPRAPSSWKPPSYRTQGL